MELTQGKESGRHTRNWDATRTQLSGITGHNRVELQDITEWNYRTQLNGITGHNQDELGCHWWS